MDGYLKVYEGAMQQDGAATRGRLVLEARERDDAINYIIRSPLKCLILVGPHGGRLIYNRSKRLNNGEGKTDGAP